MLIAQEKLKLIFILIQYYYFTINKDFMQLTFFGKIGRHNERKIVEKVFEI